MQAKPCDNINRKQMLKKRPRFRNLEIYTGNFHTSNMHSTVTFSSY